MRTTNGDEQLQVLERLPPAVSSDSLVTNALMLRGLEILTNLIDRKYEINAECGGR